LVYGTYLGGVYNKDYCRAVAVDAAGCAYITGDTRSQDFPAALGPGYDTALGGAQDAFVVKLSADGKSLPYATFIGGGSGEIGYAVDLDNAGCAYIAGETSSSDLLAAGVAGYDKTLGGESDAFVVKLNAAGRALVYGTLLGGGSTEVASGLAVDAAGRACLVGETSSTDYPTGPGFDTSFNGASGSDCFVSQLSVSGTALLYGSYLGSNWNDTAAAVALDGASCAYLTGAWPEAALPGAGVPGYDKTPNGTWDAFAAKLRLGEAVQSPRVRLPVVWR
jgi:hypothetical protein